MSNIQDGVVDRNAQQFLNIIDSIAKTLENIYLKDDEAKKKMMLLNSLRIHVAHGGKTAYSLVPQKFAKEIETLLYSHNVPYLCCPDNKGNVMFIVRDKDNQKLLDNQNAVECLSTDYAKELTPKNIVDMYTRHGMSNVDIVTVKNPDMALVSEQKLFQSGVTFAKMKDTDGSTHFLISPSSKFSEDGKDLCSFELSHALEQSRADWQTKDASGIKDRFAQARFDQNTLETFARKIKNGETCVLHCATNHSKIYVETSPLGVAITSEARKNGKKFSDVKKMDISPDASLSDIIATLSRYTTNINDMTISSKEDFIEHENCQEIKQSKICQNYARPKTSSTILKSAEDRYLKQMMSAVNTAATAQVKAMNGEQVFSQEKLYEQKHNAIQSIMHDKSLPEIQQFLNAESIPGLPKGDRQKWYDLICQHFDAKTENSQYEAAIEKTSKGNILRALNKSKMPQQQQEQQAEMDDE